jgi:hypothetical protein
MGFVNQADSPIILKQCMNASSPLQPAKHKLSPVKASPQTNLPKRPKHTFPPSTISGTPEKPDSEACHIGRASSSSPGQCYTSPNDEDTYDEFGDIELYYKAFNKHRPELGESNAEAMTRHQSIEDEYHHLKERHKIEKKTSKYQQKGHELTPSLSETTSPGLHTKVHVSPATLAGSAR